MTWRKSSHSAGDGGDCVEMAPCPHAIHVRDSKDTARPGLTVTPTAWATFITFVAQ
ncbi:DUF397 domain-containing protein [Streptomyces sp. NPDC003077]|uniref:DUF397 domain-containing protein n=1 Tax=Streptomyces sp. NPDC003077 TaxID=3154443 RepID=UPI0033A73751